MSFRFQEIFKRDLRCVSRIFFILLLLRFQDKPWWQSVHVFAVFSVLTRPEPAVAYVSRLIPLHGQEAYPYFLQRISYECMDKG